MDDEQLLLRVRQNDSKAYFELVSLYKDKVLNTCYRFLLNKEDAEDTAQEVFIEVFQSIKMFRGDSKLSTWIYRITVTKCLDEIKKRKRKKRISSIGRVLHLDDVSNWLTGGKKADTILYEKESQKSVYEALEHLPDNQRVAFTLSKIEGYNNSEIAAILKTTNVAVESLLSRAKKKVTARLEKILKNNI